MITDDVAPAARFRSEVLRTADRLRGLTPARLGTPGPDGRSVAAAAHASGQRIVAATAAVRGTAVPVLPRLADHAAGDQLAVVGTELADLAEIGPVAADVLSALSDELVALRRAT